MIEVEIDLYGVGYFVGYYGTKVLKFVFFTGVATSSVDKISRISSSGYRKFAEIATAHAIDTRNADIVTENLFDCLKYID